MTIDSKQVQRIAKLARLHISEDKYEMYATEMSKVLDVIDKLQEVDTAGLDPVINVNSHRVSFRKDIITDGNCDSDIIANAPKSKFGYFLVPKVVE